MMREVTGAFFGSRRLDEALEDLRAEGIASDRVRVADMTGFDDFRTCLALSASAPTQWITAEHLTFADESDYGQGLHSSDDDILPAPYRGHESSYGSNVAFDGMTRVVVKIRDDAEWRAVCDIFSRLGTDDVDAR